MSDVIQNPLPVNWKQKEMGMPHPNPVLSKGKARAELRPTRRQARLPHSRSLLLPGRER